MCAFKIFIQVCLDTDLKLVSTFKGTCNRVPLLKLVSTFKTDKAFYFVFALKSIVEYFFCSCSILLSWFLLIKPDVDILVIRSVTSALASFVIATGMWILNIVIMKILDCRYRDKNFFRSIQDLISHEYILQTLLGLTRGAKVSNINSTRDQLKWIKGAFANMFLVSTGLHTISSALYNSNFDDEHQLEHVLSTIFKILAIKEIRNIQETDLLRVMKEEDIANVFRVFEGAFATKSICEASLRKWLVKVFNKRKLVVCLLNNTTNATE
ncbi:hypothetical protein POM88_053427 [Heracleum sosnowskyi]|uniref:Uncharacterized protein n=1 Tax=Heracleum sosnowskyi TaxID=360622 RepID=A0AAD8LXX6_9APIA|nr:hypothetical protein POM88_053427 [Heracleum sosnowskyi]